MKPRFYHGSLRLAALAAVFSLGACASRAPAPAAASVEVNLVAINDFHGNLERSRFKYTSIADQQEHTIQAGGIDVLAAALQAWRREDPQLLLVGAGDLVGASPAMSSMWADEPSIAAMNLLGLRATSVGNHEFDHGRVELLRQQNGGCASPRPQQACQFAPMYEGAKFSYLAANVLDHATGKPFMPAYRIEEVHGVKIAFIGTVLKNTAAVALASGIAGLDFIDEADAVNRALPELRAQGVGIFVVLIHQGGSTADYFDQPDCAHLQGDIVDVVKRLDPAIELVVSGHSHHAYTCRVDGRLVTQAETAGHVLTRIKLHIDASANTLSSVSAANVVMTPDAYPADPRAAAYLAAIRERSQAALSRPVARLAVPLLVREKSRAGESPLGDLVADSVVQATRSFKVRIAFMNNGGMRKDLESGAQQQTDYGQTQAVLPFNNTLVVMSLSGAQIRALLEQQWHTDDADNGNLLQISSSLAYRWDRKQPAGHRVVPGSVTVDGAPLGDAVSYRVAMNNFLAEGGDRFRVFADGGERVDTGISDLEALRAYLAQRDRAGKPAGSAQAAGRMQRLN
ncbi:MAG TPA: bifunctional metallophosphatase/5'-nucleotidase [Janthinobacterium sp.]|nr:bifunctional metallophosphatase/5'-nucleotidase [Janthinobacterium sp.]